MDKTSKTLLPNMLGFGSMAHSAGLVELAVTLCLNQRKELCPHVWVPILKPQRPCLRAPVSGPFSSDMLGHALLSSPMSYILDVMHDDDVLMPNNIKNKRVVFADSKGLSLTAVRVFSEAEDQCGLAPLPSIQDLGSMTDVSYSCTVSTCCPGTQLKLGFPQPSADFQAFRAKLAESMVTLENCTVNDMSIQGTARVRNVSYKKDVCARITFNSWQSYKDVPCTYLEKRYGGPQMDIFEFDIPIPKVVDAKKNIEFCLRYLPGGHTTPFWDNNGGQNYAIRVSVNSHLCRGKSQRESA